MNNVVGQHIILDVHNCKSKNMLTDVDTIRAVLVSAAIQARATVVTDTLHSFGVDGGVTGVIVLAESHISIHTWPEHKYAAVDIFMCGDKCNPIKAAEVITNNLNGYGRLTAVHERGFPKEYTL